MKISRPNAWLGTCILMITVMGCGSSPEPAPPASSPTPPSASAATVDSPTQTSSPVATAESAVSDSKKDAAATKAATTSAGGNIGAQANAPEVVAEADAKTFQSPTGATSAVEPATAFKALGLIDLEKLPRLNAKMVLDEGPTYVYYSTEGSLASVDAFYKAELAGRGWVETPSLVTGSDQYVDRMFTKDGFMIRAGLSSGSSPGEVGIMLANLGNVENTRSAVELPVADFDSSAFLIALAVCGGNCTRPMWAKVRS